MVISDRWLKLSDMETRWKQVGRRTITAPAVLAQSQAPSIIVQENNDLRETLARLNERLNEPFVTVNTVTGDLGIKQAQDDYQRLMNNKSPKNKRK